MNVKDKAKTNTYLFDTGASRDVVPSIVRAAGISRDHQVCLDELLEFLSLIDPQGRLFLPKLRKLPETLQRHAVYDYLSRKGVPDLSRDLLTRCLAILDPEAPAKVNLPGDLHFQRRASRLFVG